MKKYDKVIIGGGLYGLYAALYCAKKNQNILVLEYDDTAFARATYVNQARVHMGYHYPRSYNTATKSANYYNRFLNDFGFCINEEFDKIYAISKNFSWTDASQFEKFCNDANIPCQPIQLKQFFNKDQCEGAYLSKECTFDAILLKKYFIDEISKYPNAEIKYSTHIKKVYKNTQNFQLELNNEEIISTNFVLNATYGAINQVLKLFNEEPIKLKYELCEVILCKVNEKFKNIGITMMDGPFFSLMPFGKSGLHSLTAVHYTPHKTSKNELPTFSCQTQTQNKCSPLNLDNCNTCIAKPKTSWEYMKALTTKYLSKDIELTFEKELFSIKTILLESEVDDARPTIIKVNGEKSKLISVLSGKINTVYDLDEYLQ